MPSAGPTAYNEKLALLDVEMAKDYGVFREDYADKKTYRKAAAKAGLSWPMVQAEYTGRSGGPGQGPRNEKLRLEAMDMETQGLPVEEGKTWAERARNRFREEMRAKMELSALPALSALPSAKPSSPEPPKPRPSKTKAAPAALAPAPPATKPVIAAAATKPAAAPALSAKEAAILESFNAEYEEVTLGGTAYWRHKELDSIYAKGAKVGELGDAMPDWDEDLGEWKSE